MTQATLKIGPDILQDEKVAVDRLLGHGGLFKTPGVAQRYLAAAAQAPVTVMKTAGEGGPYGMALLAGYRLAVMEGCTLNMADYLQQKIFADAPRLHPGPSGGGRARLYRIFGTIQGCAERRTRRR